MDRENVIKALEHCKDNQHVNDCNECDYGGKTGMFCIRMIDDVIAILKEHEEFLKHEYWRGYNNGRADERGLQEGTIMQTFSPD